MEAGTEVRPEPAVESLLGDAHDRPAIAAPGDHVVDGARPCRGVEIAARALLSDVVQHSRHSMEDERLFAADSRFKALDVEQREGQVVI